VLMSEIAMGLKNRSEGRVRKAECLERGTLGLERGKGRKALPIVTIWSTLVSEEEMYMLFILSHL